MNKLHQIIFFEPKWFALLLFLPLFVFIYLRYSSRFLPKMLVSNLQGLTLKKSITRFSPDIFLLIIRSTAIILLIIALTDPQLLTKVKIQLPKKEANIILALDVSKSMMIEDIKPNRLEALKDVLNKFVAMRLNDRIGIVLYARESIYWSPLSQNYAFLLKKLNKIDDNNLADGTAIGLGLTSAINALQSRKTEKNKVIVLITDGENNAGFVDPLTAAAIAKHFNIKVYTISIGKTGIAQISLRDLDGKKYEQKIEVSVDEQTLKKIAVLTGGLFFRATDVRALENVYTSINKLEANEVKWRDQIRYTPLYNWFAIAALGMLVLELALRFTFLRSWPR